MVQQLKLPAEKLEELVTITQSLAIHSLRDNAHRHELSVIRDHAQTLYSRLTNTRLNNQTVVDDDTIHYLRSPLNIVSAYTELLLEDDVDFEDKLRQIRETVQIISAYLETLGS